ncbi:BPK_collapsed_G0003890.mRNA.1.CDS.1 [Saccharomyces cerevisiae]|nr:CBM_collapsed_G0007720.mRNA.1.CDS.1 [Saccharomyces cerevisiae]CAI7152759.1 BPK_collapsed_G0003890.mRNA.1.CDS.1 [Saccharomyces cerevisiae]
MAPSRNGPRISSSKALLSSFIARSDTHTVKENNTNLKHASFMDKFNSSLSTISESFQSKRGRKNKGMNEERISNHNVAQEQKNNMDISVSIEELQDALNTELLF